MEYCSGSSLAVDWDEEALRARRDPKLRRRVVRYFQPHWRQGALVLALLAAGAIIGLVPAFITKEILDSFSRPGERFSQIALLVAAGLGASVVGGLLGVARSFLEASISQSIMFDLRSQLFDRLLDQSVGFFTESRTGEVMSRINNDVKGVEDVVSGTVFGMIYNLLVVPATLAFMVVINWRLTMLLPLFVGPLVILPTLRTGRKTFAARKRTQEQLGRMTAYLQEVLGISGILLVKAFVRPALLWLYGGYLVLHGQATVGTIVTFVVVLAGRLSNAVTDLASLHVSVIGSLALFQRLFDILDMPLAVTDAPGARPLSSCRGAIAFEGVTFSYRPDNRPAIEDLSFRTEPGQLVALVGPTGAGKSTVTYLVSRSYDPQRGRVLVDSQDVRELTLDSLGSRIGTVFQDIFLFHTSIRDNLRYARLDASDDELVAAAKAAYLHDFITSLPDGYDTIVGERGHRLSGGEKQRLAIARGMLKDPRILILDEATSHLDTVSEHLIQAALRPLLKGRTSLVIAHRLSTILAADLILVLDRGHLVEQGTHAELVELGGLYARLYERQFSEQGVELPQLSRS